MNKSLWITGLILVVIGAVTGVVVIPNPVGEKVWAEARYQGYVAYTPDEAVATAYARCTTCHDADKILKYCSQCGPPFIVVSQSMKKYLEMENEKGRNLKPFSDAEIVAITQAWNALVGNWEPDWRLKDVKKLLQGDAALIHLAETPIEQRPIEMALKGKSAPGSYLRIYDKGMAKSRE
ncbi:MAG: hypothetical protein Q9M08_07820 [Mariprofundus sp.]|nr:hypothetical protein [Mariprofundus sp.]